MTTKAETGRHFTAGYQKQPRTDLLRVHSECENSRNRTELGLRVQMTPAERIASDTWRRLGQADLLGARLGEETFTDLLVLDMLPHRSMNAFCIHHPTKPQESLIGADLLICIPLSRRIRPSPSPASEEAVSHRPVRHARTQGYVRNTSDRQARQVCAMVGGCPCLPALQPHRPATPLHAVLVLLS